MAARWCLHDVDVAHELGLATPDALIDTATLQPYARKITALIMHVVKSHSRTDARFDGLTGSARTRSIGE